jgi:oligopeptidase B
MSNSSSDLLSSGEVFSNCGHPFFDPNTDASRETLKFKAVFDTIRSYSPSDNVRAQRYPAILALAGLADPRVTYWGPAKWVTRLRATMTGGGPILLRTATEAGHAGAPGRFDRLEDVARQYAFAIACVEGGLERAEE